MIVLGKTADDKGAQLERLVADLLRNMGYTNVVLNKVGSGGEELDISAEYTVPGLGGGTAAKLIGECKAYKKPVDVPAWLKFLGKLFTEETRTGNQTMGCLIALAGVNGNCQGAYEEVNAKRKAVTVLTGDRLRGELGAVHPFVDERAATATVRRYTGRTVRLLDLAYYDRAVYWVIGFSDASYTLLRADANPLDAETARKLCRLIKKGEALGAFVDLQGEEAVRRLAAKATAAVVGRLIMAGGSFPRTALYAKGELTDPLLQDAIGRLQSEGVILVEDGRLSIPDPDVVGYAHVVAVYRNILSGWLPSDCLGTPYYDRHINEKLLDEILAIQGGVVLTPDERARAVELLRLSPSGLAVCLRPIEMIVNGRGGSFVLDPVNRTHVDLLFTMLHDCLRADFSLPFLTAYFLNARKLVELDTRHAVRLKSQTGVVLEDEVRNRTRLGELGVDDPARGPRYAVMTAFNAGPEPWEEPGATGV